MKNDQERALRLAIDAGHILLENGAEIGRVEETMEHIATSYGVDDGSFFVLSNGIIATGQHYASAEHIPIQAMQLSRVVEVNQLSREVTGGKSHLSRIFSNLLGGLVGGLLCILAVLLKCPTTVFLVCGIIPLVPGGGIFWTAYYLVGDQLRQAAITGFTALKVTIAIAAGIILINAISRRLYKTHHGKNCTLPPV